jgi:hypothetical protein
LITARAAQVQAAEARRRGPARATDEFFGRLFDAMAKDSTQKSRLTDVFGDWKPGNK